MSARGWTIAAAGGAALVVVVLGLGLGWWWTGAGAGGSPPASPLAARATLAPAEVLFGDQVRAAIVVAVDRSTIDPSSVRVEPAFAPYAPRGLPTVTRTTAGRLTTIRYAYTLECTSEACLPGRTPLVVRFPPAVVTAGGRARSARVVWPQLLVSSRIPPGSADASAPRFAAPDGLPPVRFAVRPGVLADLLATLAGVLSIAAVLILVREARRLFATRRRNAALSRTPLEVALERVREAAGRPEPADRRKALGHLARILAARGEATLAATTDAAAWMPPTPDHARMLAIADEVETSVGAR